MTILLQMTGTGNAFAKSYYNNSALIHSDPFKLMIDFGHTVPLSLHQLNITLNQINGVLISHLHADHTGGLEELGLQSFYRYGHKHGKIKLFIPETLIDGLWENTLKAGMYSEQDGLVSLEHYFDVVPLKEKQPYSIYDGLTVEIIRTNHIPNKLSYSFFINDRFFYSADMTFNRELLEYAAYERKCSVILHDCQLLGKGLVHTTLEELLSLPDDIQSLIYLMHYEDDMPQYIGKTGKMTFIEQHRTYEF